jgi:hypothetical protein
LGAAGLIAGYIVISYWSSAPATPPPSRPAAAAEEGSGGALPPLPPDPRRRGSSISVVGGLSPEEMARLGVQSPPGLAIPSDPVPEDPLPEEGVPLGPPIALQFSPEVREAARRYLCLCGRGRRLAECRCTDRPLGAETMLAYVEKLLNRGLAGARLDAGMVDRYGEHVLRPPSGAPTSAVDGSAE